MASQSTQDTIAFIFRVGAALDTLHPLIDNHWLADGSPNLRVVAHFMASGETVTEADVRAIRPKLNRKYAEALRHKISTRVVGSIVTKIEETSYDLDVPGMCPPWIAERLRNPEKRERALKGIETLRNRGKPREVPV